MTLEEFTATKTWHDRLEVANYSAHLDEEDIPSGYAYANAVCIEEHIELDDASKWYSFIVGNTECDSKNLEVMEAMVLTV